MEITLLDKNSIRIKGKKTTLVVDPKTKTVGDCVLILHDTDSGLASQVEGSRLVVQGPGEYEVGGTKISALKRGEELLYIITIDSVALCLAKSDAMQKSQEAIQECSIAVFLADELIAESLVAAVSPKIAVVYGEKALESTKAFGKEIAPVNKIQISAEKLPEEMQVVVLG